MNFAFLAFNELEELDLIGPWEFIASGYQMKALEGEAFMVAEKQEIIACSKGLKIEPHYSFDTCPDFEYILVPGGWGTRAEAKNPALLNFLKSRAVSCKAILSVCTGAFLLAETGLLKGKRATTHWGSLQRLRDFGGIEVVEERYVQDGNIWCSAGVSAGMDMTLAFVNETFGEEIAEKIQFYTEYYPEGTVYGNPQTNDQAPGYIKP